MRSLWELPATFLLERKSLLVCLNSIIKNLINTISQRTKAAVTGLLSCDNALTQCETFNQERPQAHTQGWAGLGKRPGPCRWETPAERSSCSHPALLMATLFYLGVRCYIRKAGPLQSPDHSELPLKQQHQVLN